MPTDEVSRRWLLGSTLTAATASGLAACGVPAGQPVARASVRSPELAYRPTARRALPRLDAGQLRPNELGLVPVLMLHRVTDPIVSEYDITPDALWDLLVRLHAEGYRPVRVMDLVRGRLGVPCGRTPVVLTFDDSSPGQFHRRLTGVVDPRSGIGVLLAFARRYPAFTATATLYLNGHPFDAPNTATALRSLDSAGFELGNHTLDHVNLGQVTSLVGQREIVGLQDLLVAAVPGRRPVTFSLPYGVWPADHGIAMSGSWLGRSYRHEGVLLVGSSPAPSPFALGWDPTAIPRIRASSWANGDVPYCANWWLDRLARDPQLRYVSAGRPGSVTYPHHIAKDLHPRYHQSARPY